MGTLQSVMQSLSIGTDDEEDNAISSWNAYELNSPEKSEYILTSPSRQWQKLNRPTRSHSHQMEMEYLTVTVPELRSSSSSPAYTSLDANKVKNPASPVKKNARRRRRVKVPVRVVAAEDRWITHYSSRHRILLVGEGDFSFSTCLAKAFGFASNMVATSLDPQDFLVKNYGSALSNLVELCIRKCCVMHEINATEMANHPLLGGIKFDRIIFNFPFAGFFKELPREAQLRHHRTLVSGFLGNANRMLSENGEIHITHKINGFHKEWKLEALASLHKLRAVEVVEFNNMEYEGYNTKCGFGGDNNFNCNPSMTYKFKLLI